MIYLNESRALVILKGWCKTDRLHLEIYTGTHAQTKKEDIKRKQYRIVFVI